MVLVLLHVQNCHIENFILFSFKKLCYTQRSVQDRKISCLFVERRWKSFSVRDNKGSYFLTFIGKNGLSTIRMWPRMIITGS